MERKVSAIAKKVEEIPPQLAKKVSEKDGSKGAESAAKEKK